MLTKTFINCYKNHIVTKSRILFLVQLEAFIYPFIYLSMESNTNSIHQLKQENSIQIKLTNKWNCNLDSSEIKVPKKSKLYADQNRFRLIQQNNDNQSCKLQSHPCSYSNGSKHENITMV